MGSRGNGSSKDSYRADFERAKAIFADELESDNYIVIPVIPPNRRIFVRCWFRNDSLQRRDDGPFNTMSVGIVDDVDRFSALN